MTFSKDPHATHNNSKTSSSPHCSGELPQWTTRPFCRSNTQSEPEDYHCTSDVDDSDEDVECLRCCKQYYYTCKRSSAEFTAIIPEIEEENSSSEEEGVSGEWDSEDDDGTQKIQQRQTLMNELSEGFWLVFFVALPMLARQFGSVVSRRVLSKLFGCVQS